MAVPYTRQRAKELVQQIAKDHGYLGEEKLRTIEPELRREIEEALLKKDQMIGSTVITLAKNLYTSKARFVFELLQNADDNDYTKAITLNKAPYVSFHVYPRRLVMECNEDGFTDRNLEAICSVGKSSKTGSQGYIGEKGIGFKSVFMAAWKAHIQSGAFSFSFTHRNGESGMGMISPVWEDSQDARDSSLTRLTLHLHDDGNSDVLEKTHEIIQEQFRELQETILLFMRNLRIIRFSFHGMNGAEEYSVAYSIERPRVNRAVLVRTIAKNGTERKYVKHYHVTTHQAIDIPRHDNRTYSGQEDRMSEVVLAFPISETSIPIVEPHDIFAYLPVRPMGFKFIIQADFVTDASRQDIVRDSSRNIALLDGVAAAFSTAVLQFCEYDGLRLQWMRYLPDRRDENWGHLWRILVNKIAGHLSDTPVLYCHKNFDRHPIRDLFRLKQHVCDNGEPLFEDGDPEIIVSQRYSSSDLAILEDYGLKYANFTHLIKWLATDLDRGARSRMRSATTTSSWHTQAAKLLHRPFSLNLVNIINTLKTMALLPLKGGTWVSTSTGPVFHASVAGLDIPPNIGLRVIDETITNPDRLVLFQDLGVQEAPIPLVRRKILEMYRQPRFLADMSVQTSKQHLTFLYLTEHLKSGVEPSYSDIFLFDQDQRIRNPSESVMYMATDRSLCSPWELLREVGPDSSPGSEAPGFMAHYFLNDQYFMHAPQSSQYQPLSWVQWFHRHLKIPKYVYLGNSNLSDAAKYLEQHRPERFLGALRIHHLHNRPLSPEFIACVRDASVMCRGNQTYKLSGTYFPTKRLESLVGRFVKHGAFFPWLWLEGQNSYDTVPEHWDRILRPLEVGIPKNDFHFGVAMLLHTVPAMVINSTPESKRMLFSLYCFIQAQYRVEGGSNEAKELIQMAFTENDSIYIPLSDCDDWVCSRLCVWSAGLDLNVSYPLQRYYESLSFLDHDSKRDLEQLFRRTIGISDCTLEIYVFELKHLQMFGPEDIDHIKIIYKEIHRLWRAGITPEMSQILLRRQFEVYALIYVPSNDGISWRKTSKCVWSTAARLRDMVSLNNEYEDLEDFFVNIIGVKPVTLSMAIDELKEAGSRQSVSVEEVKASLLTVNSLLCSDSDPPQSGLMDSKIFPVKYPEDGVHCVSVKTHFFIVDREPLRSSFEGRVKFLDFSLEEVVHLHAFLDWAQLDDRYISRCVREFTSVQNSSGQPISHPDRQFRYRAHALLRIAKHFESPRVTTTTDTSALYELLRNAKIFSSDAISLELILSQDGASYKAIGGSMSMHLHEDGRDLTIYLPRRKVPQQHAFNKHLPEKLLQCLMTEKDSQICQNMSDKAINAMKDVWNTPLATLATTLDECGIIKIETPNIDPVIEEVSSDSESDVGSERSAGDWVGSQSATQVDDSNLDSRSEVVNTPPPAQDIPHNDAEVTPIRRSSSLLITQREPISLPVRLATPDRAATQVNPEYLSVLENVITSAATSTIPGRYEEGSRRDARTVAWRGASRISGATPFERDCKIGAAGELFVFELLSHLEPALPDFSRDNWQSTMRRYIRVHPAYASMSPWTGRETSDIVYHDTQGVLTELLILNRYLDRGPWDGRTPQYFIEVKTTTSSYDTPFFMSDSQHDRMRSANLSAEGPSGVIYVIFRVYQLDQDDQGPGLKIYVDPEALKLSGELDFTSQGWSVVPRAG